MDAGPRAWIWVGAGLVGYVLAGPVSLFIAAWVTAPLLAGAGIDTSAGTVGHSSEIAPWPVAWGLLGVGAALVAARPLRLRLRADAAAWVVLLAALALAATVTFLDMEWGRARYGMYDAEYSGLLVFAPGTLVAVGLAAWAIRVLLVLAVAGLAASIQPSLPGLGDGMEPDSLPLAAALVSAASFSVVVTVLALWTTRRRQAT